jgi:AraC family transcriptional regulator of adaptative response / DNA-3-methyladenine glycosylase II
MNLDRQICLRARLSRDPRFDGKFFTGVRSTKIYCRSVCPVPTVKEKNVCYFATAAEAAESGYRPCLRCRPECSPGTPAWCGTSNTVSRALRLIADSELEDSGMEGLAERLGVGSRHLRRLFMQHLGAPPSTVAKTRRLHFAKKLIDETGLPMTHVAMAAGFGCVRRFNAAIQKTYSRTPTQIRRLRRHKEVSAENEYVFQLRYRPPYPWKRMLAFFAECAIPGIETVDERGYRRTIAVNAQPGWIEVTPKEEQSELRVRVKMGETQGLFSIIERIRRMFDLNADWASIAETLEADAWLKKRIGEEPGLRVPGSWDGFELAVRAIMGQETSANTANRMAGRLVESFGTSVPVADGLTHIFPNAEILANAPLSRAGVSEKHAVTIRALARAVRDREISFARVADSDALADILRKLPGMEASTVQYVAMRGWGDPDVFTGIGRTTGELQKQSEAWRPWRSYGSVYLWKPQAAVAN